MSAATETVSRWTSAFEAKASEPAWLAERRRLAIERFSLLGFPTTRHEEYKYTNLAKIANGHWGRAEAGALFGAETLAKAEYAGLEGPRAVFVDGEFRSDLSDLGSIDGLEIRSLAEVLDRNPEAVEGHLTRYADFEDHALAALNTAFFDDGAYVRIADKAIIENPVHLIFVSTGLEGTASYPRVLIEAGRESQAKVIESYIAADDGAYWTNSVTEIIAEEAARIEHFQAQQESLEAYHTGVVEMLGERNSYVSTISLSFGAALTRNDVHMLLNDEGCECALDGLYIVGGSQHVDHHTLIDHAKPNCNSHQLYKGVLDGASHAVFNGKIIVRKDAQKTDAIQNNKNLLLSRKAEIDTKPQLEIDANDVRCTHGATVGQLDENAVFYLRSRGIGAEDARGLLTYAFAADLLERVTVEPLRDHFEKMLIRTLAKDPSAEVTH